MAACTSPTRGRSAHRGGSSCFAPIPAPRERHRGRSRCGRSSCRGSDATAIPKIRSSWPSTARSQPSKSGSCQSGRAPRWRRARRAAVEPPEIAVETLGDLPGQRQPARSRSACISRAASRATCSARVARSACHVLTTTPATSSATQRGRDGQRAPVPARESLQPVGGRRRTRLDRLVGQVALDVARQLVGRLVAPRRGPSPGTSSRSSRGRRATQLRQRVPARSPRLAAIVGNALRAATAARSAAAARPRDQAQHLGQRRRFRSCSASNGVAPVSSS